MCAPIQNKSLIPARCSGRRAIKNTGDARGHEDLRHSKEAIRQARRQQDRRDSAGTKHEHRSAIQSGNLFCRLRRRVPAEQHRKTIYERRAFQLGKFICRRRRKIERTPIQKKVKQVQHVEEPEVLDIKKRRWRARGKQLR